MSAMPNNKKVQEDRKEYISPDTEVIRYSEEDIILTSDEGTGS